MTALHAALAGTSDELFRVGGGTWRAFGRIWRSSHEKLVRCPRCTARAGDSPPGRHRYGASLPHTASQRRAAARCLTGQLCPRESIVGRRSIGAWLEPGDAVDTASAAPPSQIAGLCTKVPTPDPLPCRPVGPSLAHVAGAGRRQGRGNPCAGEQACRGHGCLTRSFRRHGRFMASGSDRFQPFALSGGDGGRRG